MFRRIVLSCVVGDIFLYVSKDRIVLCRRDIVLYVSKDRIVLCRRDIILYVSMDRIVLCRRDIILCVSKDPIVLCRRGIVLYVSKGRNAFTFRVKQSKKNLRRLNGFLYLVHKITVVY
jgi:hypothetical protein